MCSAWPDGLQTASPIRVILTVISLPSPHPRAPAGLPPSPPPLHSITDRIQAVIGATVSDLLHIPWMPRQCRPGSHQPLTRLRPQQPWRLRVLARRLQHRPHQCQSIGLPLIHLSGPHQRTSSSFEVASGAPPITARRVEHRVISNNLCGARPQVPTAQPLNDSHRLFRIGQVGATGPVTLAPCSAGSHIELIEEPYRPLWRTLGIGQAQIGHGRCAATPVHADKRLPQLVLWNPPRPRIPH